MSLIVIRLHPAEPIDGADFRAYLTGLRIEAFDLSINNPLTGASLGTATYRALANPPPLDPFRPNQNSGIVQHWGPAETPPLAPPDEWKAVATAVIRVPPTAGVEHASRDLRLVLRRGTGELVHRQLYFNVPLDPRANRPPRRDFPDIETTSLYLSVPAPGAGIDSDDYVELPADGSPPPFEDLRTAVQAVLNHDPGAGNLPGIADLTPPQARHVAYEIVWNQAFRPLPQPKLRFAAFTGTTAAEELDALYTLPESGEEEEGDEINRATFEGDLQSYYATGNADAERLTPYIYALSAALRAETLSTSAPEAGFLMPVSFATNWKAPVRVRSSTDVNTAAPGATIDGVTLAVGDRVALMAQTVPGQEGIYDWNGAAAAMTRPADADSAAELMRAAFLVQEGSGAGQQWMITNTSITLDTTDLTFAQVGETGPRFKSVRVVLASAVPLPAPPATPAPLATPFTVPAQYFYALGATLPTTITAEQRFRLHTLEEEDTLRSTLQTALDSGVIQPPIPVPPPLPAPAPLPVNVAQAARRLRALGAVQGTAPRFALNGAAPIQTNVQNLVRAWLAYQGEDILRFWTGPPPITNAGQLAGHLELVLRALTLGHQPLIDAIKASFNPASADDIDDLPADDWAALFVGPNGPALLPAFTQPGTIEERVAAFVRHVQRFFAVTQAVSTTLPTTLDAPLQIPRSPGDPISRFAATLPGGFTFGQAWNPARVAAIQAHIAAMLPGDEPARAWLFDALSTINELSLVTGATGAPAPSWPVELAFSLIEALYARGFTSSAQIAALAREDFRSALIGTVAWEHADTLHGRAGGQPGGTPPGGGGPFRPVNPDSCLVNCIPPPHRSPLGPVAYLHDLLQLTEDSTCDGTPEDPEAQTLRLLLADRRGDVGDLAASRANLETPIPVVDLVNECLEALVAGPPGGGGVVYDTNETSLGGHLLDEHDPATLFAALPEHSTPATPVKNPGAYDRLRAAFSAPALPYAQALDVNRTYLCHLRSSRYATMRRFRANITELALDPANQPADFQQHLWRYPVRRDLAAEYLCLSPEELDRLFTRPIPEQAGLGELVLHQLYGFDSEYVNDVHWTEIVVRLPEFLARTGLSWCEFLELWRSGFVGFTRTAVEGDGEAGFPECEPCHLEGYRITFVDPQAPADALRRLAVFIRLWRKLQLVANACYSFAQLRDLCLAFGLFRADGTVNPDFIGQLAAFQILRDDFGIALTDPLDPPAPGATGPDRTHLLALWAVPPAAKLDWALDEFLDQMAIYARRWHGGEHRGPEFIKLLADNLSPLSLLAGFDPGPASPDRWNARPTHTLRFAEVLAKIYASDFGIGEVLLLCTADPHLEGDDPFPLQPDNEALDDPLALPDDRVDNSLWALRDRLREAAEQIGDEDAAAWTWDRVEQTLQDRFDYSPPAVGPDPLRALGTHFFPSAVQAAGIPVTLQDRQYRRPLAPTSAPMWNTPPGPFRYDTATQELYVELPLTDEAVIAKLSRIRQLSAAEQRAVRELYFAPRADLAPFALLFENFGEAEERLLQEPDEGRRWAWFQRQFALFYRRCELIAEHLAAHVNDWSGRETREGSDLAWRLLRQLYADENPATAAWERDGGQPPPVTWPDRPTGGAFAALLGLVGTGLLGEYTPQGGALIWREVRGPMSAFGTEEDTGNTPVPTVLPAMDLVPTADEREFVDFRNGFATANVDGALLGGAQGYRVRWTGVLLIEADGRYEFRAGAPTPDGQPPDFEAAEDSGWLVTLQRGQRRWALLSHQWPDETVGGDRSDPLPLLRGAYHLTVELVQPRPVYRSADDLRATVGGFQVKYAGPDTGEELVAIPHSQLFRDRKDGTLAAGIQGLDGTALAFLQRHYTSSLRDMRRTYQRAYVALLLAHRFQLSAQPTADDGQSEIGYLLAHPDRFAGVSYYRAGAAINSHRAFFDPNLLPLRDNYLAPTPAQDQRAGPSVQRRQALLDWWERLFDYTKLRRATESAPEPPVWLLFHEAAESHPDIPAQLQRHMRVDQRHIPQVLTYIGHTVTTADLEDDRWTSRVFYADAWFDQLRRDFLIDDVRTAQPDLWAADDPGAIVAGTSGNDNLTKFVRDGCIENDEPRRYADIQALNDGLRLRGRAALLAYLNLDPPTLQELLLLDIEAGLCERASRIEDAISAVQSFVRRARLGLEPTFTISAEFALLWDRQFATFRIWEACVRRRLYRENWIDWTELEQARRGEAFRFLEAELRRQALTTPIPGGLVYWPATRTPDNPSLTVLQAREPAHLRQIDPQHHGFDLRGTPQRHARPSWLAQAGLPTTDLGGGDGEGEGEGESGGEGDGGGGGIDEGGGGGPIIVVEVGSEIVLDRESEPGGRRPLPWWVQAAIRVGVRFIRVAAAGDPPAATPFAPHRPSGASVCCEECGRPHPATVDEYYFWLLDARFYRAVRQVADDGTGTPLPDPTNPNNTLPWSWHDPRFLPRLLYWATDPSVYLAWSRVHDGEFIQPRRSAEPLRVAAPEPELALVGRTDDSLLFTVSGAAAPTGFASTPAPGFRYDLAPDTATPVPQVLTPPTPTPQRHPGSLESFPFFAFHAPGVPVMPTSMHAPAVTVAASLRAHCQFEAALRWYELAYPPLRSDNHWLRCPQDDGEGNGNGGGIEEGGGAGDGSGEAPLPVSIELGTPEGAEVDIAVSMELVEPEGIEFDVALLRAERAVLPETCCHDSTIATEAELRDRSILLNYLETLDDWGRALLRANTPESFQQARVVFDTLTRLLGPTPRTVLAADPAGPQGIIATFTPDHAPLNPRLLAIYERNTDQLALIHACLNAHRLRRDQRPYWADTTLRDGWKGTQQPCLDELDWCAPDSCYRFGFLIQRAQELAGELRTLGANLRSAFEAGDAEYLSSLRATHERQLTELTLQVREQQWREADWQLQALGKTKEIAETRLRHLTLLIQDGTINREDEYFFLTVAALALRVTGNISEGIAQGIGTTPDIFTGVAGFGGSPLFYQQVPIGTKLASVFATAARIANSLSELSNNTASLRLTEAGWERREDDWRHQVEILNLEIPQIERQILAAERRRDVALRELNNYQRQIENSAEVHDFLRDKFTAHQLYLFLQQETAALHAKTYELALHAARQAERAFNYERGHTARSFIEGEVWDHLHEGLQAGDRLGLALRQMEQAYLDANCREYELTKHLSLRQLFPLEFLMLQATGVCEIDVPEWLFDQDYPGHYMRRIKNMSLSIPCVVGPYTGVHCRLTLLSSTTRIDPRLTDPPHACCPDGRPGNGYQALTDDPRIVTRHAATEAIATSSGQTDTGMFELNFRDERYLPFEFAGAVSRWRVELPAENNQFDIATLADVVMHLNYTAREGGDVLRAAANEFAQRHLPGDGRRYFDVEHDLPDSWQLFQPHGVEPNKSEPQRRELRLVLGSNMFPFLPGRRELRITRIGLFLEAPGAKPSAHQTVRFEPDPDDERRTIQVHCVATAAWPHLYYGILQLPEAAALKDEPQALGTLRLPPDLGRLDRAHLVCWYETADQICACPGAGCCGAHAGYCRGQGSVKVP